VVWVTADPRYHVKVVLHVTMVDGKYTTTLDSPDQNASGITVATTTYEQPNVTFEIQSVGAVMKVSFLATELGASGYNRARHFFWNYRKVKLPIFN